MLFVPRAIGRAHLHGERHSPTLAEAFAGVRFILKTRALLGTMSLDLVAVLLGGATALLPVFSQDVLHVGALGNGLLRAAPGVGAVIVALTLTVRPIQRRVGPILFLAVAAFGAFTLVFALSRSYVLSLAALAGARGVRHAERLHPLDARPLLTPPELRGRVGAVERVFIGGSNELGAFESGVAAALDRRRAGRRDRRRARDRRGSPLGLAVPAAPQGRPLRGRSRALPPRPWGQTPPGGA